MSNEILKGISVFTLWIIVVVGLFVCVFKSFTVYNDVILKKMIRLLLVSQLITSIWNLTGLVISTIAGGWILGDFMCQTFGFLNLVLTSGSVWMMAIISIERYHRFLATMDHQSTFSPRNVNIIVCGVYILLVLLSSGPLYGLGEYSFYRGHLNMTVTIDLYKANQSLLPVSTDVVSYYLSALHGAVRQGKEHDPASLISDHMSSNIGVIARTVVFSSGLNILIRSPNRENIQILWSKYTNGSFKQVLHSFLWRQYIGTNFEITDMKIRTHIDENQFYSYSDIYLETQELGICSVDFTSYNSHAIIWSCYQLVISTFIPYIIILVSYVTIYAKNPRSAMVLDKNVNEDDIFVLNWLSSASIFCLLVTFIYNIVMIVNANGTFVTKDALFGMVFIYYGNGIIFLICLVASNKCHCHAIQPKCRSRCYCPDEESAYELSDLSLRNETTEILSHCSSRLQNYV